VPGSLAALAAGGAVFAGVFVAAARALRVEELRAVTGLLRRR
jgi:hypothetical protein